MERRRGCRGGVYLSWGIAIGAGGSIYVLDNTRVQKFDAEGTFLSQWGSPGNGDGQFIFLDDIAIDSEESVYLVDSANNRVQKFDPSGNFIAKWGMEKGNAQFFSPTGISIGPDDSVYVIDNRIQKFDKNGNLLVQWGNIDRRGGEVITRPKIAVARDGSVYVINGNNQPIEKYDPDGNLIARWAASDGLAI